MLSIHFNGHSQHHPEASGRPLRDQLEEALGALGFTRGVVWTSMPAVSGSSTDKPEPETEKAKEHGSSIDGADAVDADTPKPRRGRPPKEVKTEEVAGPAPHPEAKPGPAVNIEPAPQISTSPEDRKPPEEPAAPTHDDIRMAIGDYGKKFGDDVAVKNGRTFMGLLPGQKIPEIPVDRIAAVVAALRGAIASGKPEPASAVDDLG